MKIENITAEQVENFKKIVTKWIDIGFSTEKISEEETKQICENLQENIYGSKETRPIVVLDSPLGCWLGINLFIKDAKINGLKERVEHIIKNELSNLKSYLEIDFIWPYIDGHFFSYYFAWIEAMQSIGVQNITDDSVNAIMETSKIGLYYPLDEIVIVGSKPSIICRNSTGQLHADEKPAVEWHDGFKLYFLNGISMETHYVMTPAEKINVKDILKESNVDVRRELIRKVGIERVMSELPSKLLNKKDNYELYSIDLSEEVKNAKFLKMTNPSIGVFHVEAVDPSCNTVAQALLWRNNNFYENAEILT